MHLQFAHLAVCEGASQKLEFLSLNIHPEFTFRGLLPLFRDRGRAELLESLGLANCTRIDPEVLEAIAENCSSLKVQCPLK